MQHSNAFPWKLLYNFNCKVFVLVDSLASLFLLLVLTNKSLGRRPGQGKEWSKPPYSHKHSRLRPFFSWLPTFNIVMQFLPISSTSRPFRASTSRSFLLSLPYSSRPIYSPGSYPLSSLKASVDSRISLPLTANLLLMVKRIFHLRYL